MSSSWCAWPVSSARCGPRSVELSQDGLTPAEQLEQVRKLAQELMAEQDTRWLQLSGELSENGIAIVDPSELDR